MIDYTPSYFDVLPLHPPPKSFESLTSYLMRLAEINKLGSLSVLSAMCFPEQRKRRIYFMKDYPPTSFGSLQAATFRDEFTLKKMTFYHLGEKFGRTASAHPLSAFLSGSVAEYLRFCPLCLKEHSCHSLLWRFLTIQGCHKHSCRLLTECGYCKRSIPLFMPSLKMGHCAYCKGDLSVCSSELLTGQENLDVSAMADDVEFLLSPHPVQNLKASIAELLGREFVYLRHEKKIELVQVTKESYISERQLEALERGFARTLGTSFQKYLEYSAYLGIHLRNLFEKVLQRADQGEILRVKRKRTLVSEEDVIERIQEAVETLRSTNASINSTAVRKIIPITEARWNNYHRARQLLKEFELEYKNEREKQVEIQEMAVLMAVQEAIEQLKMRGEAVTYRAVSEIVGLSSSALSNYPRVKVLLIHETNYATVQTKRSDQREEELLRQVHVVIKTLEEQGELLTLAAISRAVGVSQARLKMYPQVKELLCTKMNNSYEVQRMKQVYLREEELLISVTKAIKDLEGSGLRVTQRAVGKIVGVNPRNFKFSPRVMELLDVYKSTNFRSPFSDAKFDEAELVRLVKQAMQQLDERKEPVTYKSVSQIVEISKFTLRRYPQVRSLLEQRVNDYHDYLIRRFEQRESEMLISVEAAIQQLKALGIAVTQIAIGEIIGMKPESLKKYPRVKTLLRQESNLYIYHNRRKHFYEEEDEVIAKVERAIEQLQSLEHLVTINAICEIVKIRRETLKNYNLVEEILQKVKSKEYVGKSVRARYSEDELLIKVEAVICQMRGHGYPITQKAISRSVELSPSALYNYPRVSSLVKKAVEEETKQMRTAQFTSREEELILQVQNAIQHLQQSRQPIKVGTISDMVQMSLTGLYRYPKVKEMLQAITKKHG